MGSDDVVCLYRSGEIAYSCIGGVLWQWRSPTGREWRWEGGVLYYMRGFVPVPVSRQPDWKAGIQFSLGFEAGRTLLPLAEGEGRE